MQVEAEITDSRQDSQKPQSLAGYNQVGLNERWFERRGYVWRAWATTATLRTKPACPAEGPVAAHKKRQRSQVQFLSP